MQAEAILVRQHLTRQLGGPIDSAPLSASVEAFLFAPPGIDAPVLYSTCGLSQTRLADGRRIEALVIVRPRPIAPVEEAIHGLLREVVDHLMQPGATLMAGSVFGAPDPLRTVARPDTILMVPPFSFPRPFHRLQRPDGQIVELLWLMPVYEAEAQFGAEHGPDALMTLFGAQGIDLVRFERAPANTKMSLEEATLATETTQPSHHTLQPETPAIAPREAPAPREGATEITIDVRASKGSGTRAQVPIAAASKPPSSPPPPPRPPSAAGALSGGSAVRLRREIGAAPKQVRFDLSNSKAPEPQKAPVVARQKQTPAQADSKEAKRDRVAKLRDEAQARAKERPRKARAPRPEPRPEDD